MTQQPSPSEPLAAVQVVSIIRATSQPQTIPSDGQYHVIRFPYDTESYDPYSMHEAVQPDGYQVVDWKTDDRSGLIWPSKDGWGHLTAVIQWEAGDYRELRDQFVRDPLSLTADPVDTTGTDHRPPSPGIQCFTKHHEIVVHPGAPIALRVGHNATTAKNIILAELKLAIFSAGGPDES
ncbi:hypothetical protein ADL29_34370 [Streptomyces chattanoogensis]|uniref:Uncharacterized protein n=1 Tax=Streptomyces chattanoogensis TaxID=66876 RepID=A0A0N0XR60_9ACTN|nr:hypothetical protein ADL29_34370 [Streptomyces chattanoogensis]